MNSVNISDLEPRINPHGVGARLLMASPQLKSVHLTFKPGDTITPHASDIPAYFYVLDGSGVVTIGDETKEVSAGCFIESPAGLAHGWENNSLSSLKLLVFKPS
jgi:quercetin dioxygenase-like cupin family protein